MASSTVPSSALFLLRLLVGWVFLVEGILKFMWPEQLGYGRFLKIGIPGAHFAAPIVGGIEILCGILIIVGLFTRFAAVLLLIDICVAIVSTKVPILLGHNVWHFQLADNVKRYGILSMLHESRTDFSMLLGLIIILITGHGVAAIDYARKRSGTGRRVVRSS